MAVIFDRANGAVEIPLNDLLIAPSNIGKVFNLDAISMLDILHRVEKTGMIKIIRTAGLDVIHVKEQMSFEQCVKQYYQRIQKQSKENQG